MALLARRWGPKEQVREAYSPFYRVRNGTVMSLQPPYDITCDVPNTSLTVPGNIGKRLNRSQERLKKRNGVLWLLMHGALEASQPNWSGPVQGPARRMVSGI